jgi:methylated-DNA-[protein]-cysteine S-methyltransferase
VRLAFEEERYDVLVREIASTLNLRVVHEPARLDPVKYQLAQYFDRLRRVFDLPLDLSLVDGLNYRVARQLGLLPYGHTTTYGALAAQLGLKGGARAVGSACGANPIPVVLPCHRVIRSDGSLGGFRGKLELKQALLKLEGAKLK